MLDNLDGGWNAKVDTPHLGNHLGYTTIFHQGKERHYIMGGQRGSNEPNGNTIQLHEFDIANNTWSQHKDMLFPRGHLLTSTVKYGNCGFLIMGGAINGKQMTSDISYYSIDTNTWTKIGDLPRALNSPVCTIAADFYIYCQGGLIREQFAVRRQITVTSPILLAPPPIIPTDVCTMPKVRQI
jgi:N-acetylneuraminic acid mutarotase